MFIKKNGIINMLMVPSILIVVIEMPISSFLEFNIFDNPAIAADPQIPFPIAISIDIFFDKPIFLPI